MTSIIYLLGAFLPAFSPFPFVRALLAVAPGPGPGPAPMSQFGTMSRQISRHNPSISSVSMVSATGTYRRAPSVTSQSSIQQQHQQQQQQPHINGGTPGYGQNSSKVLLPTPEGPQARPGSALQTSSPEARDQCASERNSASLWP